MALEWTAAEGLTDAELEALRTLDWNTAEEIYHIRHRSVYRARLVDREVAIKEVRFLRFRQRVRLRYFCSSKAVFEFETASRLYKRKPITPKPLAFGHDQTLLGLKRDLQVYQWLPEANTLTDCVRAGERPWETLVPFLWDCASLGLVHGGHSSENLMHSEGRWWVIDLADASLRDGIDQPGFVRDVARIARKLIREEAADEDTVDAFVRAVTDEQGPITITAEEIRAAMATLLHDASRRKG